MGSSPPKPGQWRFTWEALAHTPTLRLYLFRPGEQLRASFSSLRATLRLDESLLLVSFADAAREVLLRLPVPRVLIDPALPVDCRSRSDHIEVKLGLLLPVDHPVVAEFRAALGSAPEAGGSWDRLVPLSLNDDLKNLSSGDLHFYCKTCSTRLTKQPLRHIVEMPSLNWQDVADNWFGGCCCSFGGASENLVSRYINSYDCSTGITLVNADSVIIGKAFLEGCTFHESSDGGLGCRATDLVLTDGITALQDDICDLECEEDTPHSSLSSPLVEDCYGNTNGTVCVNSEHQSLNIDCCTQNAEKPFNEIYADCCHQNAEMPFDKCEDEFSVDPVNGCFDGQRNHGNQKVPQRSAGSAHNIFLGGGFMSRASNLSKGVAWAEVLCKHCSSPLGSYPSKTADAPVDGGIQLFKCRISTYTPGGDVRDVSRKHTVERVFANLVLEAAEDEISFRTVVRDMKTKRPMLQIVLLSSNVWCFTGYCFEDDGAGPLFAADLQPVVKVMFRDCDNASESNSRLLEDWVTKYQAEEVYMMGHLIEELAQNLILGMSKLPPSCSSFEGMYLSSLER